MIVLVVFLYKQKSQITSRPYVNNDNGLAMGSLKVLYEENKGLYIRLLALEREKNEIPSAKMR